MTFLPFKVKNSIYSSNMHFISCDLEPQAVKQHIFGGLWQLKIKSRRHSIKFRWCMPQTAAISSVPGYGLMMGSKTKCYKNKDKYAFCITPHQTLSGWSCLGNLQMIAVMWRVSEMLMSFLRLRDAPPGSTGVWVFVSLCGECERGLPCCCLRLKREVPLCQHQPKVTPWLSGEQSVGTKRLGKGAPSLTDVHKTWNHLSKLKLYPRSAVM